MVAQEISTNISICFHPLLKWTTKQTTNCWCNEKIQPYIGQDWIMLCNDPIMHNQESIVIL